MVIAVHMISHGGIPPYIVIHTGVIAFLTMFTHGAVRESRGSREEQHLRCTAPPASCAFSHIAPSASSAFSSGEGPTEAVSAHGPVSFQHNTYYVRILCLPFFSFLHPSLLLTPGLPFSSFPIPPPLSFRSCLSTRALAAAPVCFISIPYVGISANADAGVNIRTYM